ncbi:MAG: O-antigen ligase family protein [Mariniphaga sp.]|nr:O-antigen ligase family protein [Mariniphaga sp.]
MDTSNSKISSVTSRSVLLITGLTILSALFITTLAVNHELHDPVRTGKMIFFARWMVLVIPVGLFIFIRTWKQPFSHLSLLVLIWGSWIFLRGKYGGIWHDEKFFWFAGCFVFYFLALPILQTAKRYNRGWLILIPVLVISLIVAIEAVLGLLQLYGGYRVYHAAFKVTGTFFNPAPYGGFLLGSLPMALLLTSIKDHRFYRKIIRWTGWFAAALILVIIPSTQSRAAYLGTLTALGVWTFFRYKPILWLKIILNTRKKRLLAGIVIPVVFAMLFCGLYWLKKDSADGRLLIWKVAAQTIREKPLTGNGFNSVQATLAPAQAAYFTSGKGSESEQMLAGSVRWVFNEPLQAASETGLPGALLLLLVTGYALFYKIPKPISRQQYLQIGAARATVAGIMVFGCFSYPFYSLPVTLLFFFSLAVLSVFSPGITTGVHPVINVEFKLTVVAGSVILGGFYLVEAPKLKQAYWLWDEAASLYQLGAYHEANESFSEALPVMQYNGLFLQQYGKSLYMEGRHEQAVSILTEAGKSYKDEFSFIALGDCYKAVGEYGKAEGQYMLAASMVPHKFYPNYLLAKLYDETGQKEKAIITAKELLEKEIKVESTAIEEINQEMQKILEKDQN